MSGQRKETKKRKKNQIKHNKKERRKKETKRDCREQNDEVGETFCRQPFNHNLLGVGCEQKSAILQWLSLSSQL